MNTQELKAKAKAETYKKTLWEEMSDEKKYKVKPSNLASLKLIKASTEFRQLNRPINQRGLLHPYGPFGYLMDCRRTFAALSYSEWVSTFLTEVMPYSRFYDQARIAAKQLGISHQFALDVLFIRAFIETDAGFQWEQRAFELASAHHAKRGESVRFSSREEDVKWGVDLIVLDRTGNIVLFYQVKQPAFFAPAGGPVTDQEKTVKANYVAEAETGAEVFYLSAKEVVNKVFRPITLTSVEMMCFGESLNV